MHLIQVSDMHLGIFTREYNKVDPMTGMRIRTEDFTKSFLFVTDFALKEHVDAILMCGDTFDRIDPVNKVRKDVLDSLMKVTQHGVKVVIIGGNHDTPRLPGSASPLQLLDHINGVYVFHRPISEPLTLQSNGGSDKIDIYPFPYLPPARWFDYAKNKFSLKIEEGGLTLLERQGIVIDAISHTLKDMSNVAKNRGNSKSILMMHYMIQGSDPGHTTYVINDIDIPKASIPFNDFTYVACGHVHKYQGVFPAAKHATAFFSGSTERTSFNEMDEEKGFILLDASKNDGPTTEFIRVPTRPMKLVPINAPATASDGKDGTDHVVDVLKVLEQVKARGEEREAIIRIFIRNATPELKASVNLKQHAFEALLGNAFHWDLYFEMREDQVHPSVKAGEVFLKPHEELRRYIKAMNTMSEDQKKRVTKLGEQILEDVLGKTGEE